MVKEEEEGEETAGVLMVVVVGAEDENQARRGRTMSRKYQSEDEDTSLVLSARRGQRPGQKRLQIWRLSARRSDTRLHRKRRRLPVLRLVYDRRESEDNGSFALEAFPLS